MVEFGYTDDSTHDVDGATHDVDGATHDDVGGATHDGGGVLPPHDAQSELSMPAGWPTTCESATPVHLPLSPLRPHANAPASVARPAPESSRYESQYHHYRQQEDCVCAPPSRSGTHVQQPAPPPQQRQNQEQHNQRGHTPVSEAPTGLLSVATRRQSARQASAVMGDEALARKLQAAEDGAANERKRRRKRER